MERSAESERLITVSLDHLLPHPLNPNIMSDDFLHKLATNIQQGQDYPPLVVRPHPDRPGHYQLLDGHQRHTALQRLGHTNARCYLWPCTDPQALTLIATLNRLQGQDQPLMRAQLLNELAQMLPQEDLSSLLPETEGEIQSALKLVQLDTDALLEQLQQAQPPLDGQVRLISFVVPAQDEPAILQAIDHIAAQLTCQNRRGRALATLAHHYLASDDNASPEVTQ